MDFRVYIYMRRIPSAHTLLAFEGRGAPWGGRILGQGRRIPPAHTLRIPRFAPGGRFGSRWSAAPAAYPRRIPPQLTPSPKTYIFM